MLQGRIRGKNKNKNKNSSMKFQKYFKMKILACFRASPG
jgi:hypothetical protein